MTQRTQGSPGSLVSPTAAALLAVGIAHGDLLHPPVTVSTAPGSFSTISIVDIDGDTDLDIVSADVNAVRVLHNDGAGAFTEAVAIPIGATIRDLDVADMDADGDIDIIVGDHLNRISVASNDGLGVFAVSSFDVAGSTHLYAVHAHDANQDGIPDIIVGRFDGNSARSVAIYRNFGASGFQVRGVYTVLGSITDIDTALISGDARPDIVVTTDMGVYILRSLGSGSFAAPLLYPTVDPQSVAAADIDADGDTDLAVPGDTDHFPSLGMYILRNNAGVNLAPPVRYPIAGISASGIALGRLDAGLSVDAVIVSGDTGSSVLSVMSNDGAAAFTMIEQHALGTGAPTDCALGDLDRDADLDVVVSTSSSVAVLFNSRRTPRPRCPADINNSGTVDASDFVILAANFGASVTPGDPGDLNNDGLVNAADFTIFAAAFGATCP
mgnify:CR=1 FL=1